MYWRESVKDTHLCRLWNLSIVLLIFCLVVFSIIGSRVLKTPTVIVGLSPFNSISFCFTCFEALLLGAYMFVIIISYWCVDFIYCLSSVIIFILKSVLFDTGVATSGLSWLLFVWSIFSLCSLSPYSRLWIQSESLGDSIVGPWFFNTFCQILFFNRRVNPFVLK